MKAANMLTLPQKIVDGEGDLVLKAEMVKKRNLLGYLGDEQVPFIKLTVKEPRSLPKVRDKFFSSCFTR